MLRFFSINRKVYLLSSVHNINNTEEEKMWTRRELKTKAKQAFMINYWKTVLVSLILVVLVGGAAGSFARAGSNGSRNENNISAETTTQQSTAPSDIIGENFESVLPEGASTVAAFIVGLFGIIAMAIAIALNAFLINPLEVGCKRFFSRNLNRKADVNELAFAYDNNYLNIVKTTFLRDIYTILWALLFIIPGIIKAYEYRMIPYILADHPEMSSKEVFAKSKELMHGQKWRAFVLDLSFIGWEILSLLTARILGVFFVSPYRDMTNAALYEKLEYGSISLAENN